MTANERPEGIGIVKAGTKASAITKEDLVMISSD